MPFAKLTLSMIRERYPNPIATREVKGFTAAPDEYCVGGACLRTATELEITGEYYNFPSIYFLTEGLIKINPFLSKVQAHIYASSITHANDSGDFDSAWSHLSKALAYGNEETIENA